MTAKSKKTRPVWQGMNFWKWPSIVLVLFCIVMIYPYATRGGGSNGMGANLAAADLDGCPLEYEVRATEDTLTVLGRIATHCAPTVTQPTVMLVDAGGDTLVQTAMRGGANSLRGRLTLPDNFDADQMQLTIVSTDLDGEQARIDATPHLAAAVSTIKQEQ